MARSCCLFRVKYITTNTVAIPSMDPIIGPMIHVLFKGVERFDWLVSALSCVANAAFAEVAEQSSDSI